MSFWNQYINLSVAFLCCFLLSGSVFSQDLDWAILIDGNNEAKDIVTDNDGFSYVAGRYVGVVDFDPGPDSAIFTSNGGGGDSYIAKYDSLGNFIWVQTIPNFVTDYYTDLYLDNLGNIYCAGDVSGGGFAAAAVFHKRDCSTGNIIWAKSFYHPSSTGNFAVHAGDIMVDTFGDVIVTGSFYLNTIFSSSPLIQITSVGNSDIYIAKLDSAGALLWVKVIGGVNGDEGENVQSDSSGNIYVTGTYQGTVDFDPGAGLYNLSTNASPGRFFLKLTPQGDFIRAQNLNSQNMAVDRNSNLYFVTFNSLQKVDSSGNGIWAKSFVSVDPYLVQIDSKDNIWLAGGYSDPTNDFDPGPGVFSLPSVGYGEGFFLKLNQQGDFLGAIGLIGPGLSQINGFDIFSDQIFSAGKIIDSVDFDPSINFFYLYGGGSFVTKYLKCSLAGSTIAITGCDSLSINNIDYFQSGNYYQTVSNVNGCDSTISLIIEINSTEYNYISLSGCDSVNYDGSWYYQSGIYDITYNGINGCDSIIHLDISVNNSYSNIVNVTGCESYFFDGNLLTASGLYTFYYSNVIGCDSIVTINLTIGTQDTVVQNILACNDYYYNGITLNISGTYTYNYINQTGCDSIIILNPTINNINTNIYQIGPSLSIFDTTLFAYWVDCNNNFLPVAGGFGPTYTPTVNGSYAAFIFENGCMDTSACINVINVGLFESEQRNKIKLYPNPYSDQFTVFIPQNIQNMEYNIELYDTFGRKLMHIEKMKSSVLDLMYIEEKYLLPGNYVLKLCTEYGQNYYSKICKSITH